MSRLVEYVIVSVSFPKRVTQLVSLNQRGSGLRSFVSPLLQWYDCMCVRVRVRTCPQPKNEWLDPKNHKFLSSVGIFGVQPLIFRGCTVVHVVSIPDSVVCLHFREPSQGHVPISRVLGVLFPKQTMHNISGIHLFSPSPHIWSLFPTCCLQMFLTCRHSTPWNASLWAQQPSQYLLQ